MSTNTFDTENMDGNGMFISEDFQTENQSFRTKLKSKGNKFFARNYLVIDIGTTTVKMLVIYKEGNHLSIINKFLIEDANKYFKSDELLNTFGLIENIKEIIQMHKIKIHEVYLTGHYSKTQTKLLPLPMLDKNDINIYVKSEVDKHFSKFSHDTDTLDYMLFGKVESEESKNIMGILSVAPILETTKIVDEFKKLNLKVTVLDVELHCLNNLVKLDKHRSDKLKDGMFFKISDKNSQVVFSNKGITIFERQINFGVKDLIKALQNKLEISNREAEVILKEYGVNATEDVLVRNEPYDKDAYNSIIQGIYSEALTEVIRSYQYVVSNYELEFSEITIVNGGGNLKHIAALTKQILDIEIKIWSIQPNEIIAIGKDITLENLTGELIDSAYSVVTGLALRGIEL